jgi:hypothetical protein
MSVLDSMFDGIPLALVDLGVQQRAKVPEVRR